MPGITPYQTQSAVLFVIFNRPDTTARVFEAIRAAKPARLYIAADAPRPNNATDTLLCEKTKAVVKNVDWDCDVKTLYRTENAGCKEGVSSAVNWFFSQEEEGIILEDDCLPASSFFRFCDTLLDKYRNDTRIRHITGCNLQGGKKWGRASYYFSNRTHVWGWASWRRAWADYDITLSQYNSDEVKDKFVNIYPDPIVADCWLAIFNEVKNGQIDSWAYPLDFINFFNNGLTIIPNENLISNIGFNASATNTKQSDSSFADVPMWEMEEITHPLYILPEKQADLFIINYHFEIDKKRRKQNSLRRKVKRWFNQTFNQR